MKIIIAAACPFLAGCVNSAQIDVAKLKSPPEWSLAQESALVAPKAGDDLVKKYNQCYVKVGRARDKHAITSRWIKNVLRKQS